MNKLRILLATVMAVSMMGCASPVSAQADLNMENPKFLRYEDPILGLNEEELLGALGRPGRVIIDDCLVPYQPNPPAKTISIPGNSWVYIFQGQTLGASLILCVVRGHAVAERRQMSGVQDGKVYGSTSEILDLDLVERAFKGELDDSSRKERINPSIFRGPKYDI